MGADATAAPPFNHDELRRKTTITLAVLERACDHSDSVDDARIDQVLHAQDPCGE